MSVTAPAGFVGAGGSVGIKSAGAFDCALVATADGSVVPAAGVFTQNRMAAAPVQVSRAHLGETGGRAAAVLVTSGNANAATGKEGVAAARALCRGTAEAIGVSTAEVLVCQTGLIGIPFPLASSLSALPDVVGARSVEGGRAAAQAIMTTDTHAKQVVVRGDGFCVGGMAKGAAMLAPNMATMLAVLTTDADISPESLQLALREAVIPTFNAMTIDGCTSTNDTVLVLASGLSGPVAPAALTDALTDACGQLAAMMVGDAEGGSKVAHVTVRGARNDVEAHRAARKVAGSLLVKCSLEGEDPYWGRVVSELGSADVAFDPDLVSVAYGDVVVCAGGVAALHDAAAVAAHMASSNILIACDLGLGEGTGAVLTCDLGHGYINENRTTS